VAGDFYFFERTGTHVFYAAADCTGHGVPGALVSVVCSNALSECVRELGLTDPGQILDRCTDLVIEKFRKGGTEVKDGMDISLLAYELKGGKFTWAGANNPLWVIPAGSKQVNEIKGSKQPVGLSEQRTSFKSHKLEINKGDQLFLFTDGLADQFGGPKGKKFKYKQLMEVLSSASDKTPEAQQTSLYKAYSDWKSDLEQVDDILVMGIRFS
jgi:serine phosphatase RsbU (regulator of sigma subunit)